MLTLGLISAMMTEGTEKIASDSLKPELRKYFESHPDLNYARLADELHILIEMVFGKDHSSLSASDKDHLKDLHDVFGYYKLRSSGDEMNMSKVVSENKERVVQIMETHRWVIKEVRSRYSKSQIKYVAYLLDYMDHVQRVVQLFLSTIESEDRPII